MEQTWHIYTYVHVYATFFFYFVLGFALSHSTCYQSIKFAIINRSGYSISHRSGHTLAKSYRSVCTEPLVAEEGTCDTSPTVIVMILYCKFLSHGIHKLALVQLHKVLRCVVLVHLHIVVQILIARSRIDVGITTLVVHVQAYREQMTAVVVGQIGRRVLCSAGSYIIIAIGKSVLSYPLVVGCERNQSA